MRSRANNSQRRVLQAEDPKSVHIMVFGPSQFGKSSFINNILDKANANCARAEVGDGGGESVTISVKTYTMKCFKEIFPDLRDGYDLIKIIDVPGLFDSKLRIDKKEIFTEIKQTLLDSRVNTIDAILLFESVKDDARKALITYTTAMQLFDESFRDACILLTTKWDRLNKRETSIVQSVIDGLAVSLKIETQKWQNNCEDYKVSEDKMNEQFSELGSRIKKLTPYKVSEMDNLLRRIDELAEQLQNNDPNRFATKEETIEIQEAEEYIEDEIIKVTEWIPLSEEEINSKAQSMFENQIPIPGQLIPKIGESKLVKKTKTIPYTITKFHEYSTGVLFKDEHSIPYQETHFKEVDDWIEVAGAVEYVNGDPIKMPLQSFRSMMIGQMKPESIEKSVPTKKVRTRPAIKKIEVDHERFEFSHYQKLATNQIKQEILDSVRSNT